MASQKKSLDDLLTVEQAASELGLSLRMVRQHIAGGSLPARQFGRAWAIRRGDVTAFKPRGRGRPKEDAGQ